MPLGSDTRLGLVQCDSITLDSDILPFKKSVRYLGVTLDCKLTMHNHVSAVCQSCFYQLRRIASIRPFLSYDCLVVLVLATVISRLDYCNSTFSGIT